MKARTSIYINQSLKAVAKQKAKEQGVSFSAYIEQVISQGLARAAKGRNNQS